MEKLPDKYNPSEFEEEIYKFWLENNYFQGVISPGKKPYSIVIPPPNVTGYLHIGHALNNSLQDVMIRYARMKGYSACWFPGTDHAGIATQNVVEKELTREGLTRFALGREKFIQRVWQWREQYGSRIISQLKALGCSCDWGRLRFTFDEEYVKSVNHEFIMLYQAGLIYRGHYMVNWCPRCLTAISDIEVEHRERKGSLWDIRYPLIEDESGLPSKSEFIIVSTTRPETMLGDTAVAVNPSDKRYKKYLGRNVLLPLMERAIPVIEDSYVDVDFGTGAVKVTPAHDPNDFEIGKRHSLDQVTVMDEEGKMNKNAAIYQGLDRYAARKRILEDLDRSGYLVCTKDHVSSLGTCSRCETIIEPRVSLQWFVAMKKLAGPAIQAVKEGKIKFVPGKWEKLYFNWMENIRDWCISRQLWWGHRLPVWYCQDCGETIVSESQPSKCKCGSNRIKQDEDVLDTWFSSCLWPFASMGWPENTEELKYFFPTNVLITAHDIIFFWVARMIMMSLYFMKEIPFKEVFINPLVNDVFGQKMSKSRGNVIDPMTIIEKSGADTLRFTLAALTTPGKNMLLGKEKIEGSRNFANKLWNAAKFVNSNTVNFMQKINSDEIWGSFAPGNMELAFLQLNLWDKWILSRLVKTMNSLEKYLEKYSISFACKILARFFWNDFCDWYIESAKVRIYEKEQPDQNDKETASFILWYVLEKYLKMLHPFMPHITEKIWQSIPHQGESIMVSPFPLAGDDAWLKADSISERKLLKISRIIGEIRRIRSELRINPVTRLNIYIKPSTSSLSKIINENTRFITTLARLQSITLGSPENLKGYIKSIKEDCEIFVFILDAVDLELEIKRIKQEISKKMTEKDKSSVKLSNREFLGKAPADIIKNEEIKLEQALRTLDVLQQQLKNIEKLI